MKKHLTVLGSTGSIGKQALEVLADKNQDWTLYGLAARSNVELLIRQAHQFMPKVVACEVPFDASLLPAGIKTIFGPGATERLADEDESQVVINGVSGFAALLPLLASLRHGKRVALANKESIVCGNEFVREAIARYGGQIIPVDSEQSAIFQCLQNGSKQEVERLILTASGGPFWQRDRDSLGTITPEEALRHPTWNMGKKITIDSATLFNKGLEVLEAGYLFDMDADHIGVLIHPQSIVHSMVEYRDGTVMANMSNPDMRLPIQYALTYPERETSVCRKLRLEDVGTLTFHPVEPERFPAIKMAYEALRVGKSCPIVYNGANEAAVEAFCEGRIGFLDIFHVVDYTLQQHVPAKPACVEDILNVDHQARTMAQGYIKKISK